VNKLICVIGNKGGTGKTSITHMLCHGFGLLGLHSIAVLTDISRDPLLRSNRGYTPVDGRTPDKLDKVLAKLETMPDWIGVIDGGANRPDIDKHLHEVSKLSLLPFRDSHEDIRTVRHDLEKYPGAYGVPSQWPTNPWQQMAAEHTLDELRQDYRRRLLEPVYTVSSSKLLLISQIPPDLPTVLNNVCRGLAKQALSHLLPAAEKEDVDLRTTYTESSIRTGL
jgi:cellulose biosynthesis protein BcsQ